MLVWRDAMSTGHPEIDKAQKQFLAHVNEFEATLRHAGADTAIGTFLTGLYEQTSINFSREEKAQRECGFPFQDAHHREHQALLGRLADLQNLYQATPHKADHGAMLRDLAALIKDWVSHHMVQSDVMLRRYAPHPQHPPPLRARP
ncbi:Hemerythrin [Magnetospirillum sp. XM-1]|nr:Hemerythrin [Magnetospirillum sp. XM-1]